MNRIKEVPIISIAFIVLASITAVIIFILTEQSSDATMSLSSIVNDFFVSLFGNSASIYDSSSDLWFGISIRHWAHTAEFFVLGTFTTLAIWFLIKPRICMTGSIAFAFCAVLSLLDQLHKLFVPGRHFDAFDLAMDALGYGTAILVLLLIAAASSKMKTKPDRETTGKTGCQ